MLFRSGQFIVNEAKQNIKISAWAGFIGQHYDREFDLDGYTVLGIREPFLNLDNIAWFASHTHFGYPTRNDPYHYSYLFRYELEVNQPAKTITLPVNDRIKIFAITVARKNSDEAKILQPLSDDFSENSPFQLRNHPK